jgi:hypothetical protein
MESTDVTAGESYVQEEGKDTAKDETEESKCDEFMDSLIRDPNLVFTHPDFQNFTTHNEIVQILWQQVKSQRRRRNNPDFYTTYNIEPRVSVENTKTPEQEISEFKILYSIGEVPGVHGTYRPWVPAQVREAWPDYCQEWFWEKFREAEEDEYYGMILSGGGGEHSDGEYVDDGEEFDQSNAVDYDDFFGHSHDEPLPQEIEEVIES